LRFRNSTGAWTGLGYLAVRNQDREAKVRAFSSALALDHSQPLANLELARMYSEEARFGAAAEYYLAVGDALSLVHLGDLLSKSRPEEAIDLYKAAVAIRPDSRLPHTQLGKLFRQEGRLDEALTEFKQALEADPAYGWSWFHVAATCLDVGRPGELAGWISSARDRFASDTDLMAALTKLEARAPRAVSETNPRERSR